MVKFIRAGRTISGVAMSVCGFLLLYFSGIFAFFSDTYRNVWFAASIGTALSIFGVQSLILIYRRAATEEYLARKKQRDAEKVKFFVPADQC